MFAVSREIAENLSRTTESATENLNEAIEQCSGSLYNFYCTCVDADHKALEYAASILTSYQQQISFHHGNLLTFRPTNQFDFVWCAGVFDYFNDEVAVRILKRLYRWTKTGGLCAIGNFTPTNPTRAFMELALDWHLQYRTELDYRKICARAGISSARISFDYDQTNVVLICKLT